MLKIFAATVLIVSAALTAFLSAQIRYLPGAPGRWKPWQFVAYPDDRRLLAASPAETTAFEAQLLALNSIVKQTPGFAAPVGFSVETVGSLDLESRGPGQPPAAALPLPGIFNFGAFGVYEWDQAGKTLRDDKGETTQLLFFVNELSKPLFFEGGGVPEFENLETDVTLAAKTGPDMFGMSRYGAAFILKKNPAPLWTAVSLEEALTLATKGMERRLTTSQQTAALLQQQYDDAKDPAKRAQRLAEYKSTAALVKDPGYYDTMVKADQNIEVGLAKNVGPTSDAGKAVTAAEREVVAAKSAVAALSAADRVASACYAGQSATPINRFKRDPGPTCIAIVRPNWKLFNPALPRSAPQVLAIGHFAGCLASQQAASRQPAPQQPASNPGGCPANRKLLEAIDTKALLAWLQ